MKSKIYILMLLAFLFSCSSDDDKEDYSRLKGYWIVEESSIISPSKYDPATNSVIPGDNASYTTFKKGDKEVTVSAFGTGERAIEMLSEHGLATYKEIGGKEDTGFVLHTESNNINASIHGEYPVNIFFRFEKEYLVFMSYPKILYPSNKPISEIAKWTVTKYKRGN